MYDDSFFADIRETSGASAARLVPFVMRLVSPASVVDVGCGTGTWLAAFLAAGVSDILGLDGPYVPVEMLDIPSDRFVVQDLTEAFTLPRRFDLAVCLEVAEHLPPEAADTLVESLTRLSPVVMFSAAAPYQGGMGHINEQWPRYWSARFADRGYRPVDCIRLRYWHDDQVQWWFAQNTVLYADGDALGNLPELGAAAERCDPGDPPALVHPHRYVEWVEWGIAESKRV